MRSLLVAVAVAALLACVPAAFAAFPYLPAGGKPHDPSTWRAPSGTAPNDLNDDWKFAATPEPGNEPVNSEPSELFGVRGASVADQTAGVPTAWASTTGRPDVVIAVLDSGIEWNNPAAMADVRRKVHLNTGELPLPRHSRTTALVPGVDCSRYVTAYDADRNGVVNVDDYACDPRVSLTDPRRVGPPGVLTPQDLLIAFSDGTDADHNGFVDDIAGWDFLDNDNDPYDDVQYGHGTGEARDSNAEADNGGDLGTCPNCMVMPLRVGDSFIADVNNFAQAALYATDSGASVIQEALGTLNNSSFAREAIDYAFAHGTTIIASWADEAAQHHNYPAALPHVIVVNSIAKYDPTLTPEPRSYLQLNGCTNFGAKVTMGVPSSSCSSEATGKSAGMAGLVYAAALDARDAGRLQPNPTCHRVDGSACVVTPDEVRQILASGSIGGQAEADDVNFATQPESSCTLALTPACTDPNLDAPGNLAVVSPLADSHRYPARKGFDEFYGYGRVNAARATAATLAGHVPPEAELSSPQWFAQIDPARATLDVSGHVAAVRADDGGRYTCQVYVAPGAQPNNATTTATPPGDFAPVSNDWCDGSTAHTSAHDGVLGTIDVAALKARFPANVGDFTGREPGAGAQTSNGRPNSEPYAFTVKVVVSAAQNGIAEIGEDRRELYLHRDADLLNAHFPIELGADGASPPVLADVNGDNRNELVLGTSDGQVHGFKPDGSELRGFPVSVDPLHVHRHETAYASGAIAHPRAAILASVAVGDLNHDGAPEVVAVDLAGRIHVWSSTGKLLWARETNPDFSGRPLQPFVNVRQGKRDRTQHGIVAAPVLADLDGDGRQEIVVAGMDRHVYAFHADGSRVAGFPVLVVDRSKVASIAPKTDAVTFKPDSEIGPPLNQGAIVDTPAVGDIDGDGRPDIVVGTNEEYPADEDGGINAGALDTTSIAALAQTGQLALGNSRVYAIRASGTTHPVLPGWPVKVGQLFTELLPVVGEGVTGSPVIAPVTCPSGGAGVKVGAASVAGPAYLFNPDGTSCLGRDPDGKDEGYDTDRPASPVGHDFPAFPAAGQLVFGNFAGGPSLLAPVAGLQRALDLAVNEYQFGGQDMVAAWDAQTGQYRAGFPTPVNDLEFITGPVVGDIDGVAGEEAVTGTASLDLAAFGADGQPVSSAWPKLTGDWIVATPAIGSFGTLDTKATAHKVVVAVTRSGSLQVYRTSAPACSPSSWPRFHHDIANSGDARRDAVAPGAPMGVSVTGSTLSWTAPGDDGLCGTATRYVVRGADGSPLAGAPAPAAAGTRQTMTLPAGAGSSVSIQAVDDQGNRGRRTSVVTSR